jgi:hypothetical protein
MGAGIVITIMSAWLTAYWGIARLAVLVFTMRRLPHGNAGTRRPEVPGQPRQD